MTVSQLMFIFLCHSYAFWQRSNFYLLSAELKFLPCRILIFCFIMSHVTFFGYMGIIVRNNCVCEIIIMGWGRIIILQCRGIIVWLIQHHKKNDTSGTPDSVSIVVNTVNLPEIGMLVSKLKHQRAASMIFANCQSAKIVADKHPNAGALFLNDFIIDC